MKPDLEGHEFRLMQRKGESRETNQTVVPALQGCGNVVPAVSS
jgi:hypothetical protein